MQQQHQVVGRNAQQLETSSSIQILTGLIHGQVGKLVLNTRDLASLLGKSEQALRLAEARHRSQHGRELLPPPLMKNGEGRIWTVVQIAEWMANAVVKVAAPCEASAVLARGPGRPRKSTTLAA